MGVRPALPVEGIHLIWGNELAGERVWADIPVSPIVSSSNVFQQTLANVNPICVKTRAMIRNKKEIIDHRKMILTKCVVLCPYLIYLLYLFLCRQMSWEDRSVLIYSWLSCLTVQFKTMTYIMLHKVILYRVGCCCGCGIPMVLILLETLLFK